MVIKSVYSFVKHEQDTKVDTSRLLEHDDGCSASVVLKTKIEKFSDWAMRLLDLAA